MPQASTRAIVLDQIPFKEQDRLVHLLTEKQGILKAIAPGSMKSRNRFGSLFELFTVGDFFYYWKENHEMVTVTKGDVVISYFETVSDSENVFYFYMVAEIIRKLVPFQQREPRIFKLVLSILDGRRKGADIRRLILYFLIWILRIEGMMFDPHTCASCHARGIAEGWLRTDYRGVLCPFCHGDEKICLSPAERDFIRWTRSGSPADVDRWQGKMDIPSMIRIFKEKIEFHGEFSLKTPMYLKEFS